MGQMVMILPCPDKVNAFLTQCFAQYPALDQALFGHPIAAAVTPRDSALAAAPIITRLTGGAALDRAQKTPDLQNKRAFFTVFIPRD